MRRFGIVWCAALASAVIFNGMAKAADLVEPGTPPVSGHHPDFDWAGPYIGVHGGWTRAGSDATALGLTASTRTDDAQAGLYLGYNWQVGGAVFGVDLTANYSWAEAALTIGPGTGSGKLDWNGTLRGRFGWDFGGFLLYASGGLAAARTEVSTLGLTDDDSEIGWTAGAGIEGRLARNWTWRLDYSCVRYDTFHYSFAPGTVTADTDTHNLMFGVALNY